MHAAVIGAGWAGCAAAVTLARLGHRVTVFETAPVAGGRARRVVRAGLPIDNGQHLLLGAYVQTRNVIAVVNGGDGEAGLVRTSLAFEPLAGPANALRLRARRLPAPFGLLAGLLGAKGLSVRERLGIIVWFRRLQRRDFHCPPDMTVAELIAEGPIAARGLWEPLCLAALNTPVARASAQVFANVLRAAFASGAQASDFVFASTDLSALFPDAALRYIEAQRGRVALRTRARIVDVGENAVTIDEGAGSERFDTAVIAVGPHQLDAALPDTPAFAQALDTARRLTYEPIATVWLGYATRTSLPGPIARLDDAPGQWVVDRPEVLSRAREDASRPALAQLVAVVLSASGPHDALAPAELAVACDAQLRRLVPRWPPLAWSQTIVEQRATYACTPNRPLPASTLPHPRVALAGDWVDADFPATIEAAVRTGVAAAMALEGGGR
jgi:hydroxysqualene dehydroxylase